MFAGLRLGYWWNSERAGLLQPGAAARASKLLMKTRFLLYECFGAFPGSGSANWYLSDGGHFENTAAYALLRQEAELIVVADCGADPDYRFTDLEILIRRARIDLNADILFLKPCCDADWPYSGLFGSLNDLASPSSQACLALARVDYASGLRGHLVLVKPNVSATLPVDLVNFKAANPLFPQQPTTDQFFDEAQWESYFRLGSEIGQRIDGGPARAHRAGHRGSVRGRRRPAHAGAGGAPGTASAAVTMSRLQARVLKAGAVTASIGLGTAVTFGVAAWQGIDSWRTQAAEKRAAEGLAFKDLSERWSRLRVDAPPGEAPASLAAELLRTGELLCRQGADNFMANFKLSVSIVDDAKAACRLALAKAPRPATVGTESEPGVHPAARRQQRHRMPAARQRPCLHAALLGPRLHRHRALAGELHGVAVRRRHRGRCVEVPRADPALHRARAAAAHERGTGRVVAHHRTVPRHRRGRSPRAAHACANATVYIQVFGPESLGWPTAFAPRGKGSVPTCRPSRMCWRVRARPVVRHPQGTPGRP